LLRNFSTKSKTKTGVKRKGMNPKLDDIIEVQVIHAGLANRYLAGGYVLLGVYPIENRRMDETGKYYTQKSVTFVVGRTDDVKELNFRRPEKGDDPS
jgi:hypothetical protein